MSNFITKADYLQNIREEIADQITDENDDIIDECELEAIEEVSSYLFQFYDVATIFGAEDDERSKLVLSWCKHVVLYKLYERIPDDRVPERIIKNYDDTIRVLERINSGKMPVDLPRLQNEDETPKTKFKSGARAYRPVD